MPPEDAVAADEAHTALDEIDAPPLAPENPFAEQGPSAEKFEPGAPEDVETIAARRARHSHADRNSRRSVLQRVVSLPMLIVVLLAILGGVLQWRVAVVRQFPQTASLFSLIGLPVNLRGLIFQDVRTRGEFVDGVMVLVTEGTIVNLTTRTLDVPRLRFGLRNSSGHEVYGWTAQPPKSQLASGNGLAFRTRLASPPPDGRDVIVRFFNRRDASLSAP